MVKKRNRKQKQAPPPPTGVPKKTSQQSKGKPPKPSSHGSASLRSTTTTPAPSAPVRDTNNPHSTEFGAVLRLGPSKFTGQAGQLFASTAPNCSQPPLRAQYLKGNLDALDWMLAPLTSKQFFEQYFERAPFCLKRQGADAHEYFKGLFSRAELENRIEAGGKNGESPPVKYGEDLNLAKFVRGKKVRKNRTHGEPVTCEQFRQAMDDKGISVQFQQPQRFSDPLWLLMSELEKKFGALFGANCYLTPNKNSGLAPHFDDVEVWMLQLEGRKRWRCWTPNEGFNLFRTKTFANNESASTKLSTAKMDSQVWNFLIHIPPSTVFFGFVLRTKCSMRVYHSMSDSDHVGDPMHGY